MSEPAHHGVLDTCPPWDCVGLSRPGMATVRAKGLGQALACAVVEGCAPDGDLVQLQHKCLTLEAWNIQRSRYVLILVKLQSQEETHAYQERDEVTLHTLESVHNYPQKVSSRDSQTSEQLDTLNIIKCEHVLAVVVW